MLPYMRQETLFVWIGIGRGSLVRTIFNYLIYWVRVLGVVNSPNPN